jgi:adenylate/nucleoside-diphosphate kinase
LETAI